MNRALWHTSPTHSELREARRPDGSGLVEIASEYSMISTGTERLVACGRAADGGAALDAPHAEGSFAFPIKYGYSLVGRDGNGRAVHCLHPHQSTAWVEAGAVYALPAALELRRAALLSNMETVLNGIWDAELDDAAEVLICGFGNIGALLATTLRLQGGPAPVVVETRAWRRDKARALGFETADRAGPGQAYSRIINTSGSTQGLQFCIDRCATDGLVVELSWHGTAAVALNLGAAFHRNRVRLQSSQVSTIPPKVRERIDVDARKRLAADLLSDDSFDALITNEVSFGDAPAFFDKLRNGKEGDGLIWLIRY